MFLKGAIKWPSFLYPECFELKISSEFPIGLQFLMAMDCTGLALEWEKCEECRTRIREHKKALTCQEGETFCMANRPNAIGKRMFLIPMLKKLAKCERFHLPHMEDLRMEVQTLFEKCGSPSQAKLVYQTSVELKKLCGFIKRRVARQEVTKEAGFGEIWFQTVFSTLTMDVKDVKGSMEDIHQFPHIGTITSAAIYRNGVPL